MKKSAVVLAAIGVGLAGTAWGQDESAEAGPAASAKPSASAAIADRFYISPMATYTLTDPDRGTDDGIGGTLTIGKEFNQRFAFELSGIYSSFNGEKGAKSTQLVGGGIRGLLFPASGGIYGITGVEYGHFKDHPGENNKYSGTLVSVGAGYLFGPFNFIASGISLRAEILFRSDIHSGAVTGQTFNNSLNEGVANLGLLIPIGREPVRDVPPAEAPPAEVVPVAAPVDSDGDGVADELDKCPDTPAGIQVGDDGCPLAPAPSQCKTPEAGQPITLEGCAAGDKIVLRGVNFEFNRANLTVNAKTILDGVSDALTGAPNVRVEVGGYTDSKGTDAYNEALSQKRAQAVVKYLTGKGIAADRMQSKGYGEAEPVADNETDEGRELNRRVELKIIE